MKQQANQQDYTGQDLYGQIAHAGKKRACTATCPDQEHRSQCQQYPEYKQRQQIAGKCSAQSAAGIKYAGNLLHGVLDMQCIQNSNQRCDMKGVTKNQAESINLVRGQFISK